MEIKLRALGPKNLFWELFMLTPSLMELDSGLVLLVGNLFLLAPENFARLDPDIVKGKIQVLV